VICVIPARGGSQRIPGKNIKRFHGKPIIAYSIALGLETCERTIVSTEDEEIAEIARVFGAEVHERPSALARDEIGTQEVVAGAIKDLDLEGVICALYATSPLVTPDDIHYAEWKYGEQGGHEFIYSADREGVPTGGFYIGSWHWFAEGLNPYAYGVPSPTKDIDINTPEDWSRAEKLYEEIHHGN